MESTPEAYVEKLVSVFREVWRVLKDDATIWLVLGDSYASGKGTCYNPGGGKSSLGKERKVSGAHPLDRGNISTLKAQGLKPKDLIGIPWRVAFALQADGWWLRQDIIWSKPNPMPESVKDRCTKSHEYIFLLSKSAKYYFDQEAIKELAVKGAAASAFNTGKTAAHQLGRSSNKDRVESLKRNKRSVWTVSTKGYKGSHFAVFPAALIEPCILAGCPKGGMVIDPFNGAGTTGIVCLAHNRDYIGIELNPEYIELTRRRLGATRLNTKIAK